MALTAGQRSTINTWLSSAWTKIQAWEDNYLATHGRYRQFKRSHVIPPQNASSVLPDALSDQPTNETDGATLTIANGGAGWPCAVEVHVYTGPQGSGYVAVARMRGSGGEVWSIAKQVGPETWREHGAQRQEVTL